MPDFSTFPSDFSAGMPLYMDKRFAIMSPRIRKLQEMYYKELEVEEYRGKVNDYVGESGSIRAV